MENAETKSHVFAAGWLLALSALIGTGLMTAVNWHSQPYIAENERQMLIRSLNSVIPATLYNNNILQDTTTVSDPVLFGTQQESKVYRARLDHQPVAIAMTVIAPNGYSGPISLLIGIDFSGKITGVRVLNHHETPGLGDAIEKRRSNWIDGFFGKSIHHPDSPGWKVKRDGGEFDQFTGATITPRAVVGAVHNALVYFEKNREQLFISNSVNNTLTSPQVN